MIGNAPQTFSASIHKLCGRGAPHEPAKQKLPHMPLALERFLQAHQNALAPATKQHVTEHMRAGAHAHMNNKNYTEKHNSNTQTNSNARFASVLVFVTVFTSVLIAH